MRHFTVVFRTCDIVQSLHHTTRPFGLDKKTLIKICFLSLFNAMKPYPHKFIIIGDRLSDELQHFFLQFKVQLENYQEGLGNDESLRQCFTKALELPDDEWVYLCEDDYLHQPQTFEWVVDLIKHRAKILDTRPKSKISRLLLDKLPEKPLFVHLPDYPDRYQPKQRKHSLLFVSQKCHWRQITNTTFSFLAETKTLKRYKQELMDSAVGANDALLSEKIFGSTSFLKRALCISPIPGLTTHLHEGVMTPLVDWEKIYFANKIHLEEIERTAKEG